MSRDSKTYKGDMPDQLTIVLKEIRDKFDLFGDALQFTNQNVMELRSDFGRLDRKVDVLSLDVAVLKADVVELKTDVAVLKADVAVLKTDVSEIKTILRGHDDQFDDHEERIDALENN